MSTSVPPSEERFRSLVDRVGAIVWEGIPGDRPGEATFTFVSGGTEDLLGYPPSRWLEDPRFWFDIVHPDDRDFVNERIADAARTATGTDFEYRSIRADGQVVSLRNIVRVEASPEGPRMHGVVVDITARKTAEDRLHRLQHLTGSLTELLSAQEIAATVAAEGCEAVGAEAVGVFLRDGDSLDIAAYQRDGEPVETAVCRIPLRSDVPAAEVTRTGVGLIMNAAEAEARYPGMNGWRRLGGHGTLVAIPLAADDRVLGALVVRMPADHALKEPDHVLLDVLARASAQALVRAEHLSSERAARRSAEDANALLDTIIETAPEGFAIFDRDLRFVRVNEALATLNGIPAEDHVGRDLHEIVPGVPETGHKQPLLRVLSTGEPIVDLEVTGRTAPDPHADRTWLISYYPIRDGDGEIAWLGAFVVDITARKRAEERTSILAALGTILDEVISVDQRLARLVDVLVPRFADMLSVLLVTEGGTLERIAVRHVDRSLEPVMAGLDLPRAEIIEAGTLIVDDLLEGGADYRGADPQARTALNARSTLLVPLALRDRRIGMMAFGSLRPRAFGADEAAFAEEVATRAALAIDNARLFESERAARARTGRLHAVATALAETLTAADVARATLDELLPALGAGQGSVWQLSEDETRLEALAWRGVDRARVARFDHSPLRRGLPLSDAVLSREPIWLETPAAQATAYPSVVEEMHRSGSRASATIPLISSGHAVGVLNISFPGARAFEEEDRALLLALSAQCAQALERAQLYEAERRVAVTLQRSLLPASLPEVDGLEIAVRYLPARGLEAGGDFYEALPLADGRVGIAVGDVVGRGTLAAATMGKLRSAMRAYAMLDDPPGDVLARLSAFAATIQGAVAATAVYATLEPDGLLRYACAGHPWPLLARADASAEFLREGRSVPLGCVPDARFPEATAHLEPGSTLLLYTDGLTDRRGQDAVAAFERLKAVVVEQRDYVLDSLLDRIVATLGGDGLQDDVALVAIRRVAVAAPVRRLVLPAVPERVPEARASVRAWLSEIGAPADAAGDVLLACGEGVANAVEHAYRGTGEGEVELELAQPYPDVVTIAVRDRGEWKEPISAPHRGRGLALMRSLMDRVDVERTAAGTVVRMRRGLGAAPPVAPEPEPAAQECVVTVDGYVAHLHGDLDATCAARVRRELLDAAGQEPLTIDLSGVTYLDSAGARALLIVSEKVPVVIFAPEGSASRRVFELSGLDAVLAVQ